MSRKEEDDDIDEKEEEEDAGEDTFAASADNDDDDDDDPEGSLAIAHGLADLAGCDACSTGVYESQLEWYVRPSSKERRRCSVVIV